ncbi:MULTISPECIES: hypothetical protein [unclassified Mesorhizobium]|uniref:hypothetical protein n=1 Tax=unclassified Mesorhizobium TaxID=325217 RepID=UPI000FCC789A|nr:MULTISPECIES: hypothetical protein [unclassified Mesorhizobium]RUT85523.1 hypothetical protein EOD14_17075 [Mesorhizobium sp. M7A.T.Ca.US.000.02.1.1]RUT92606.1 hypothetical protein EOD15_09755 [Mesorhizobium sp. M7A.T.Ca.US.000.02.2.1]RUU89108.1 hypothetical protein EOD03_03725 [Mesorhizobium sp. M7A.T.Ca.TU.009.01.1.2]
MDLLLTVPGASPEEIARGIAAANEVLDRAGISALEAADGMFAIEGWDDASFADESLPTGEENEAASAWIEASRAALDACCADWPAEKRPVAADLQLVDSATQLADRPTALAMLRALTAAQDGNGEFMNSQIGILADRLAVDLDNPRDLIAAVTVAFTRLELAGFHPAEPIEPKRQAVYDAINALEAATKMPTSH